MGGSVTLGPRMEMVNVLGRVRPPAKTKSLGGPPTLRVLPELMRKGMTVNVTPKTKTV